MNYTENNRLIADFTGLVFYDHENQWYDPLNGLFVGRKLRYHESWDWLMLVADKIENLETKDGRTFTIDMYRDSVLIFEYGLTTNEIVFTDGEGRFKNLYNACVQFVEWYNENKQQ